MDTTYTKLIGCTLAVLLLAGTAAPAQTPLGSEWTYQGKLDLLGSPLNDTADFEFSLHDAVTLGNQVGSTVTVGNVTVVNGLFTVELDFGIDPYNGQALWLEIAVRSPHDPGNTAPFTTLDPRQPLTAAPYALQTRGIFVDDNGNVGIGTDSPKEQLHNTGSYYGLGHFLLHAYEGDGSNGTAYLQARDDSGSSNIALQLRTQSAGGIVDAVHVSHTGNVGIGTTSASAKLDVVGTTELNGDVTINSNLTVDTDTLFVDGSANRVGIGTTTPSAPLHVVGSNALPHLRVEAGAAAPFGAFFSLDATATAGGKEYLMFSTGAGAGEGQGKLVIQNQTDGINVMTVDPNGNVGIGTSSPSERLHVCGNIRAVGNITASGSITASVPGACPDYVFGSDYELMPLDELSEYIRRNKHLPNVPPAEVVERDGINLGGFSMRLLEKTEELTLYVLDQDRQLKEKDAELAELRERMARVEQMLSGSAGGAR